MKDLKINPRFENFSPKKKDDEIEELQNSLQERGYIGLPILTWHGFIVDGHNRYHMCQKLGITITDDNIEEINLGDNAEEIDALEWMASHHLSSKNLEAGEKLALMDALKEEIRKDNEKKKLDTLKQNFDPRSLQVEGTEGVSRDTWSDNQIAKKAGVGIGTVARYNQVMKSDDEELKAKVKSGEVKVGTAYREIKSKEQKKNKQSSSPNPNSSYKDIASSYAGVQNSGGFGEYVSMEKTTDKTFTEEDVIAAYQDTKVLKNALDMLDINDEFDTFKTDVVNVINTYENRLFNVYKIQEKISLEEREYAIRTLESVIETINKTILKIKGE